MTKSTSEGWQRLPFSELAENVTERVEDPSAADVDRYVGLEHLDPGSLSIRRWGDPSEVEATKLRFKPGDVIFGRRRAYQRKLAQADFEGICSAHAMVLRARTEHVLPEFLPLFMQSEAFFKRALSISVGSLSPTINWKALKGEEFAVPPLEEQRRISQMLRASIAVIDRWQMVLSVLQSVVDASVSEFVDALHQEMFLPLEKGLSEVKYGTSVKCGRKEPGSVPVLRIPNIVGGHLDLSDLKWATFSARQLDAYAVRPSDLLLVRTNGNPDYVARGTLIRELPQAPMAYASYLLRVRVRLDRLRPEFLELVLRHPRTRSALTHLIRSSAGNYNLSASGLASLPVPMPPPDAQDELVERVSELEGDRAAVETHVAASKGLYVSLREEWLGR